MVHAHNILKAAVIGDPIAHSLSPKLHGYWLKQHHIDGQYHAVHITPDRLKDGINQLRQQGYVGFNVTIPHKQTIMALCDELHETALDVGAVNMVSFSDHGKIIGQNTDMIGFLNNIESSPKFLGWSHIRHAVLLGAGGAAYAIVAGLMAKSVARIDIVNRSADHAAKLKVKFDLKQQHLPLSRQSHIEVHLPNRQPNILKDCDLLINSTSLGMQGMDPLDLDISTLPPHAFINDIVYRPLQTTLLKDAERLGLSCQDGLGMLLHQAAPAFHRWFLKPQDPLPIVTHELKQSILNQM